MSEGASKAVVLVVDDDPMVLRTTRFLIARAGFDVLEAADGPEAVAILENRADISVLLTDSDMTPMSGPQLARIVRDRWPHLRVICMSGKPEPDLPAGISFLAKPFSSSALIPRLAVLGSPVPA